ncbi:hypothetical protein SB87_gp111 [Parapoxvirus red deer/HL953]|uniref:Chemokine binding protein n=1 Tax=Parapoxvirus red deer/HL953 TaxID=1579460 RepID=A0A0A7MA18_9POXV|nr:hypothetical protein SB87_gp111 [Parapoxvirus red deer/HL953]AIZ77364.1 hypothetical protein [Parapoxvirus red deer/HL953]
MRCLILTAVLAAALALIGAAPSSPEKKEFCEAHPYDLYARLRLFMKIERTLHSEVSSQCVLDIQNNRTGGLDWTEAYVEASGINVSVNVFGDEVYIPLSYVSVAYDPTKMDGFVYVNVSSFRPWEQYTKNLSDEGYHGLKQILQYGVVLINVGCDGQAILTTPAPPTTPPSTETTTIEHDYVYASPTPPDTQRDRKKNPDSVTVIMDFDKTCIKDVQVYFEIRDACLDHKEKSPLRIVGKTDRGDGILKEIKRLESGNRVCSMHLDQDSGNETFDV